MNKQIEDEGLHLAYILGKSDGIKQGRADAIDEIINNIRQMQTIKRPVEEMLGICKVGEMVEELMEKKDE